MADKEKRLLIIDDNEVIRKLATTLLSKKSYNVKTAENGRQGIKLAKSFEPMVILLDVMMPEVDGHEVCRELKSDEKTKDIPIIMVTSKTEPVDKIKGLELGASDYVTKPFDHGELQARVATQVKMKTLWDELQEKNLILEELTKKDGLTDLYNHRHFHERISEEFNRARRYKLHLCCVLIDLDYFKNVNDTYGHQAGDKIIKSLAEIVKVNIRDVDIAARYGGEEFALILPHTVLKEAIAMANRIREKVESEVFRFNDINISITISGGVSSFFDNKASSSSELIKFADESLYAAKANGRNRVEVYKNH